MARLEIRLLGTFQARLDGEVLTGFRSDKTRALLAYLIVEWARPQRRDWLAALLWGDYEDRSARRSLSSSLANLRLLLSPLGVDVIHADRSDVWVHLDPALVAVDVLQLRALLAAAEGHPHRSVIRCAGCVEKLNQAVELYTGPFLPGLTVGDSPEFDEWQRAQQEALHQQVLHALGALTAHHLAAKRFASAEQFARRQISLQPWHEEAHRQLMLALAGAGQRNAALTQYDICRATLAAELGIEPEERTTALYQRIRSGQALVWETWPGDRQTNPYRGLQAFREADAADFYGREHVTAQLVRAAHQRSLTALIGPSGSGKSSALHAGLIYHLRRQGNGAATRPGANGSDQHPTWAICEVRPGSRPFEALATAIAPFLRPSISAQLDDTAAGRQSLAELMASAALSLPQLLENGRVAFPGQRLLLLVDQFEELFTLCPEPSQRQTFIDQLLAAATHCQSYLSILLAVRADFMGQILAYRPLADALQDSTIMLGPMNRLELADAIIKPALALNVHLQDGLAARILNDVGQAPGRLPLLEFALAQLWELQEDGVLTHAAYEAIGQVEGALASYAEQVYGRLSPDEQVAARRILTQMVQLGQDTEDTRRPLLASEVHASDWALIQELADQRLLVTGFDERGHETAEIVHEALIYGWGRLRHWLDADRAFHLWQQRVRLAADQWLGSGRDPGALLRGAPLAEAEGWLANRADEINPQVSAFIAASQEQREQERQADELSRQTLLAQAEALAAAEHRRADVEARSARRLRWLATGLALAALLAVLTGLLAAMQRNEALRQSALAQAAQATAAAERAIAQQEAALARARQLAAQALNLSNSAPDLSILLALHALRLNPNTEENNALLLGLQLSPLLSAVLHGQDASAYSIAISPDGKVLASGGENGQIWLWSLDDLQLLAGPLIGHAAAVTALAFSPDNALLASGSQNGEVRLWNTARWQPHGAVAPGHTLAVSSLAFDPTGATLISVGEDGAAQYWDVASGAPAAPPLALAQPNGAAISADGRLIAAKEGVTITVQSAVDGSVLVPALVGHTAAIQDTVFSRDGRWLATASFDGAALIWDLAAGRPHTPPLIGHEGRVLSAAFNPSASLLATGGTDARVILWDAASGRPLGAPLIGHDSWVRTLAWTPDGNRLISGDAAGRLAVWEVARLRRLAGHSAAVRGLSFTADGATLVSSSFDQTVRARAVADGADRFPPLRAENTSVIHNALSPDGSFGVAGTGSGLVLRWSMESGQFIGEPLKGHTMAAPQVAVSPDNRIIASGSFDSSIILWDAATGEPLGPPLLGHDGWVISLAFRPDGRVLASGSADATVRLWDVASGQPIAEPLRGHTGWVTGLAWSADGATLVSASMDKTVRAWDAAAGRPRRAPLVGHDAPIWGVAFNPADGGRTLITVDNNGTAVQWDLASGRVAAPPLRSNVETESMALSPDGRWLAVGAFDTSGLVLLWRLPDEPWPQAACAIANRELSDEEWARYLGTEPRVDVCPGRRS